MVGGFTITASIMNDKQNDESDKQSSSLAANEEALWIHALQRDITPCNQHPCHFTSLLRLNEAHNRLVSQALSTQRRTRRTYTQQSMRRPAYLELNQRKECQGEDAKKVFSLNS
jgi:hypothetical protein